MVYLFPLSFSSEHGPLILDCLHKQSFCPSPEFSRSINPS
uniref:Uncharacterized protein n=1 Tax=Setaria italica TaxID=4555 RepID=K3ZPL3_SETIT